MATGPLDGMRVLDFTTTIAGPYCTRLMADLGAEVIKIEAIEGDMMRTRLPLRNGASTSFGQLNAGKQSIVLDLKRPEAREVVRRLLTTSDFVVENFRPGVMQRFGLDYETVSKRHQELIYCSISGYGQTGPSSGLAAYAPAIHAASGFDMAHMAYQPGRERPDNCGIYIADVVSGTYAFGAIMAALAQRHLTGLGQHIDVSMLETMLTLMVSEVQNAQFPVAPPGRPMFGPVRTKDGFIMPAVASEKTFQSLCQAAGHFEWIADPRFASVPRPPQQLGCVHRCAGKLDHHADHGGVPDRSRCRRSPQLTVPHGAGGVGRPAARASRRDGRGAGQRWLVQSGQSAVPILFCPGARGKFRSDSGSARPRDSRVGGLCGRRD